VILRLRICFFSAGCPSFGERKVLGDKHLGYKEILKLESVASTCTIDIEESTFELHEVASCDFESADET